MFAAIGIILLFLLFMLYLWWITHTKDAPYVPMEGDVVSRVMQIAKVGSNDVFYDLGCGDGRLVIAAAMRGAKSFGIEIDKLRAWYGRFCIWLFGMNNKATIINADLFKTDISSATVVCTYLLPETHQRLKNKLLKELKKGTKVVAVGFEYENWKVTAVDPRGTIYGPIMLYVV